MLRIHFSSDDHARVRLAAAPDPLWETLLSLHMLSGNREALWFQPWRRRVAARVTPRMRQLVHLAPPVGYSADFLTPPDAGPSIETGVAAILATPRARLAADVGHLAAQRPLPRWVRDVGAGDPAALGALGATLRAYFDAVLAPEWAELSADLARHRSQRAETVLTGGLEALLGNLHPSITWTPPVLQVAYPADRDLHLHGRGLLLVPSRFCWRLPTMLRHDDAAPTLVYPIEQPWELRAGAGDSERALARLLGSTRARVLLALADHSYGCGTSALARQLGISAASVSEHAGTLRDAGLVGTSPDGRTTRHHVTALGRSLLRGSVLAEVC
ncbi:transcriptional regulator [Pilimelia anulata]|uniref:Transcriptional regulator n=1 Tax=Pilimelia anulata TaxID=53371 RepID=A0A8J3BEM6_9ACTN|nr:winged helix-turn-helix domain-containing protein [Pilimelia anulata]GGK08251.1 transcriptional regulator [Pilimelia anulata]